MTNRIGIIDIGSNTIRLVIYERLNDQQLFEDIENVKVSARLQSYFDDHQALNQEGIRLLITTLKDIQQLLHQYSVTDVKYFATASIRQATNKDDILRVVKEETQIPIHLLTEYEEVFYGYVAVIHSTDVDEGITIDVGGGSTEVAYFHNRQLKEYHSFPFGALSLKLKFVQGDIPTDQEREHIRQCIDEQFKTLPWLFEKNIPVIAMGGSARHIGKLHQQFSHYPLEDVHQYELSVSDIEEMKAQLLPLTFPELQNIEGLSKGRADTILPSFEVFEAICHLSTATTLMISEKGIRDGVLYENWLQKDVSQLPLLDDSLNEFKNHFYKGAQDANQTTKIALRVFNAVNEYEGFEYQFSCEDVTLLKRAARLFNLGKHPKSELSSATFYLVSNRTLLGLSHKNRLKLALVASFKSEKQLKKYVKPYHEWYTEEELNKICVLGAILKVSQSLNSSNQNTVLDVKIHPGHDSHWRIHIRCQTYFRSEAYHFEKQKKHLEKLLNLTLIPQFEIV